MSKMNFAAFVVGALAGSVATWFCVKKKYEQLAQEEIDSVKEVFKAKQKAYEKIEDAIDDEEVEEYKKKVEKNGYVDYSHSSETQKVAVLKKPYVISPDDFGELDDYEEISLTYYSDGLLTDENDEIVEDIDNLVGADSLSHFGEYEDDSVFVRNDRLKCDYEILLDQRKYMEAADKHPQEI